MIILVFMMTLMVAMWMLTVLLLASNFRSGPKRVTSKKQRTIRSILYKFGRD